MFYKSLFSKTIKIQNIEYPVLSFGSFIELENCVNDLKKSFKIDNKELFSNSVKTIYELQTGKKSGEISLVDLLLFDMEVIASNKIPDDIKFIIPPPNDISKKDSEDKKPLRWNYNGRYFNIFIIQLAKTFGWTLETILNLPFTLVFYFIQEILIVEHFDKEWQYSLTELAYQYDSVSKKSKYKSLKLPYWMDDNIDGKIPVTKIPKYLLPQGMIINASKIVDDISKHLEQKQNNS